MITVYNRIKPVSIESFCSVRGARGVTADVLLARAIGCPADLKAQIARADAFADSCSYLRITSFPKLTDPAEAARYSDIYSHFAADGTLTLKLTDPALLERFAAAFGNALELIRQNVRNITETILKNSAVSLLYWADLYLTKFLPLQNGRAAKFICSGRIGYREVCFCRILTEMGIDALMLLPERDTDAPQALLNNCYVIDMGQCGAFDMPQFESKKTAPTPQPQPPSPRRPVDLAHPTRQSRPAPAPTPPTGTKDGRRELSYEELAELSPSVVLITVHSPSGTAAGSGSGIAVGRNGYILTNFHVVSGGAFCTVRLENDDNEYPAEVIKYHAENDLALIRIGRQLSPLKIYSGSAPLKRGQRVVAVGSPLGLFNSVSDGIISGFRIIGDRNMIQFTAPVSHGSSGGAVLNMFGEVIGICTAGIEGGQNINLAVGCKEITDFAGGFFS